MAFEVRTIADFACLGDAVGAGVAARGIKCCARIIAEQSAASGEAQSLAGFAVKFCAVADFGGVSSAIVAVIAIRFNESGAICRAAQSTARMTFADAGLTGKIIAVTDFDVFDCIVAAAEAAAGIQSCACVIAE